MIDIINDVIDGFLIKSFGQDSEGYLKVKSKYTTSITDSLSKGHITSNVCMIAAGALKVNPKELSKNLTAELNKL
ncbi:MAG: arginine--tRNA ligase, partial [Gammaproteobacteria bacterium]